MQRNEGSIEGSGPRKSRGKQGRSFGRVSGCGINPRVPLDRASRRLSPGRARPGLQPTEGPPTGLLSPGTVQKIGVFT